jgi:hypothetical protein
VIYEANVLFPGLAGSLSRFFADAHSLFLSLPFRLEASSLALIISRAQISGRAPFIIASCSMLKLDAEGNKKDQTSIVAHRSPAINCQSIQRNAIIAV